MISGVNFQFIQKLVFDKTGRTIAEGEKPQVDERMTELLKKLQLNDMDELLWLVQLSPERHIDLEIIAAVAAPRFGGGENSQVRESA